MHTPQPQSRLIVALDQEAAAEKLYQRWSSSPSPVALVSLAGGKDQNVRLLTMLPGEEDALSVAADRVAETLQSVLRRAACRLRRRPDGLQIDEEPSSETVDVAILLGPHRVDWAVEAEQVLSQLQPIARAGGLRLMAIAPTATFREEIGASAAKLMTSLDAAEIPCRGSRVLVVDVFDRRMRCLDPEAIPGFLADLVGSLAEPPFRTSFFRFLDNPAGRWSEAGMSAGLARASAHARPLAETLVAQTREILFGSLFSPDGPPGAARPPLPDLSGEIREAFGCWIDAWAGQTRQPRGMLKVASRHLADEMIKAEAQLELVESELGRQPDPDRLGGAPPPPPPQPPAGPRWWRRLLNRFRQPPGPPAAPWEAARRRRRLLTTQQDRLNRRLDQLAAVQNAILRLQDCLGRRPAVSTQVVSPELCRKLLARCGVTPAALARAVLEPELKRSLIDGGVARFMAQLDRWTRGQLDLHSPFLVDALRSLAVQGDMVPRRLYDGLARSLRRDAAAFYWGPCSQARRRRLMLLAYPAKMAWFGELLEQDWQPCEALPWDRPELAAIELLDGIELFPFSDRDHPPLRNLQPR